MYVIANGVKQRVASVVKLTRSVNLKGTNRRRVVARMRSGIRRSVNCVQKIKKVPPRSALRRQWTQDGANGMPEVRG